MIDTSDKNFNINLNINIKNIRTRYQYQYQYCRIQNSISISIPIPKMIKFKLNLKTIPRYLDILRSQANTQKIRASIAQLWVVSENAFAISTFLVAHLKNVRCICTRFHCLISVETSFLSSLGLGWCSLLHSAHRYFPLLHFVTETFKSCL